MRLSNCICMAFAAAAVSAAAQSYITPVKSDLTPPTPQSARPVEYQMPQPALLTGAVDLSIPLYTVTAGDYSLPLSMAYRSNGIKVLDDPCPYGYGWSLQPALRATRTILGRPDEHFEFRAAPKHESFLQEWAYQCMVNQFSVSTEYPERYDCQHDMVTLSLPGKSILRILDCSSGTPEFISGLDDEYLVSADSNLDEIRVTGPQGEKYIFGSPYESQPSDVYLGGQLRTAWALREIISPDGKSISLSWTCEPHTYAHSDVLSGMSLTDKFNPNEGSLHQSEHISDGYEETAFMHIGDCCSFLTLKGISFPGGNVEFSYDTYDRSPLLSKVEVRNSSRQAVKTAELRYDIPHHGCVFLSSLSISGEGEYGMEYAKKADFRRNLNSQDWWGYYNGIDNRALAPALRIRTWRSSMAPTGVYSSLLGHADRSVDAEVMAANMLTSMVYPTGGRVSFEYEPHEFDPMRAEEGAEDIDPAYNPMLSMGGGLRVKSVEISAGDGGPSRKVNYGYCKATVKEVPSMASFIDIAQGAFPLVGIEHTSQTVDIVRTVNINPVSNCMRYDWGETPIWYKAVTAEYAEGREVYRYADFGEQNTISRSYGKRAQGNIRKAFSGGPQLVSKTVYKCQGGQYSPVEKDSMEYIVEKGTAVGGIHISRNVIMLGAYGDFAPDLHEGRIVPWCLYGDYILPRNIEPYSIYSSIFIPGTERLSKRLHTVYADNGEHTTMQSFAYKPGTGLPAKVTASCSDGTSRTVTVEYPDATRGGVQAQMAQAGAVGVPVYESEARGEAMAEYEAEYVRTGGGAFRLARTSAAYDGSAIKSLSPLCSYLPGGQLCSSTDADGLSAAWLWGYGGLYPTHKLSGYAYSQILDLEGDAASTLNSEGIALDGDNLYLTTRYEWLPLVGLASITPMAGASNWYGYDSEGRLSKVWIGGGDSSRRLMQSYAYRIGHDAENYVEATDLIDAQSGSKHTVRVSYDGIGREISTKDFSTCIASFTEYDSMGRPARSSVPGADVPDAYAWTVTSYEPSPRGVAQSSMRPGELWHTQGLRATVRTLTNTASGEYSCPRYAIGPDGGALLCGSYAAGALLVQENADEDGHTVRTFSDMDGNVVMSAEGSDGDWLRTRRVYDLHGRLRYVLTPALADGTYPANSLDLAERAFAYCYDTRGRCVSSRAPGCSPALTRYSRAGRVVAEHSPSMPSGNWIVHFYDRHGRDALQAIASLSETELTAICDSLPVAHYDGSDSNGGYAFSHAPWPAAKDAELLHASFFDDYSFVGASSVPDSLMADGLMHPQPGLLTGEQDFMAGGVSAYYYDDEGRQICQRSIRQGFQSIDRHYDTRGLLVSESERFTCSNGRTLLRTTEYQYDEAGRPIKTAMCENGVTASRSVTYDAYGRMASETLGNRVRRTFEYDIHGWLEKTTTTQPPKAIISGNLSDSPLRSLSHAYYGELPLDSIAILYPLPLDSIDIPGKRPGLDIVPLGTYTDRLLYAEGSTHPRCTGCPTARITSLCGRYDYQFDAHDRLTDAIYSTPSSSSSDEDFSAHYKYDAVANPVSVRRCGVVGVEADGSEEFGLLDNLSFSYDGNRVISIENNFDGEDFYGRAGYGASEEESEYAWNDDGFMTADSSRGITDIEYNHQGQPTRIEFDNGLYETYVYDAMGQLVKITQPRRLGQTRSVRTYEGCRVFVNGDLLYSYFPGGYFDADGATHYMHTDYQGSVVMVTDSAGRIEQHISYYPYGEPHRTPEGQPMLYCGKERLSPTADYDYGARRHYAPAINWAAPDPKASDFPWVSPYAFCLGNPIKFLDNDGNQPTPVEGARLAEHVYDGKVGDKLDGGWQMMKAYTTKWSSSSKAGLYGRYDENGNVTEYALANAGTYAETSWRGARSVFEDVTQFFGVSTDMFKSLDYAKDAVKIAGDKELTFVGHSKGGAEAAANALKHEKNALVYNPAAVNTTFLGVNSTEYTGEKTTNGIQGMTVYVVDGEILNSFNKWIAKPIDKVVIVPHANKDDGSGIRHTISVMIEDLINAGFN